MGISGGRIGVGGCRGFDWIFGNKKAAWSGFLLERFCKIKPSLT
jgi:hypothetical protein